MMSDISPLPENTIAISGWAHDHSIFGPLTTGQKAFSLTDLEAGIPLHEGKGRCGFRMSDCGFAASIHCEHDETNRNRPEFGAGQGAGQGSVSEEGSIYARSLAAVIAHAPKPVTLAGWSTGAMVVLETAARYPDGIERLILFSATPKFCTDDAWTHGVPAANVRAMMAGIRRNPRATLRGFFKLVARPDRLSAPEFDGKIDTALLQPQASLVRQLRYLMTTDLRLAVSSIQIPTTLIHGQMDALIPRAAGSWLTENTPDSNLISLPGKGHMLFPDCFSL